MLSNLQWRPDRASAKSPFRIIGVGLLILAALTVALAALRNVADVSTVTIIYLIAVLYAAIHGGIFPAVATAVAAMGAAAFFFYPPIYDLRVHDPIHLIDLALFVIVAVVTGKLATDVRKARTREQADALREALIGSVSHELRTPISSIIGSASVLAQSPELANHRQHGPLVKALSEEAERLNEHIQNLLDATRIRSDGIRPHAEWVDPGDIVNAAVERKQRLLTGHKLDMAVADDLPLLQVDSMLVEKALGQLIENAVKYSPQDSTIEIAATQHGDIVKIAVKDQGAGITSDEKHRIWDRFFRGPRHRDKIKGSGLGLWIARELMIACGGRIEADSAGIGRGSTFALYLPIPAGPRPTVVESSDE